MLGKEGQRFVEWTRAYYDERRRTDLYDELDDDDEDELVLVRPDPRRKRQKRGKGSNTKTDL